MIEPELLEALARAAKSEQVRSRQDASSRDAQQRPWASAQSKQRRDQLAKRREARTYLLVQTCQDDCCVGSDDCD